MIEERQEYLDICQVCVRKYHQDHGDAIDLEHSALMRECAVVCRDNLGNDEFGDLICFLCASICIDCLDPNIGPEQENVVTRREQIRYYLSLPFKRSREEERSGLQGFS